MKFWKRFYLAVFLIAAIAFTIKYVVSYNNLVAVSGNTQMKVGDEWSQVMTDAINAGTIHLVVDGNEINPTKDSLLAGTNGSIWIQSDCIQDYFSCAVNAYPEGLIRIEKGSNVLLMDTSCEEVKFNETSKNFDALCLNQNGTIFISLDEFSELFNYLYEWDYATNTVSMTNTKPDEKIYPYAYDYRTVGRILKVKNQADLGTCWAFASLTALETSLLPEQRVSLSVDHMTYHNGYNVTQADGGEYTMSIAYLTSWKGPVYESDDLYGDGISPSGLDPVYHVQEVQIIEGKDLDEIKKSVFLYGGVQSSLYMSVRDADGNSSEYYDKEKSSYCYIGTDKPNHDVVIIGWDDAYSADNFSTVPEGDGAFICVNSWGENFGDQGYFYVSYFDSNIAMHNVVYTKIEETDNYDKIYQSDLCGWVGQLGYNRENAYFANVYEVEERERIRAVGFYATGPDTEYEVYAVTDYSDADSLSNRVLLKKGLFANAGYYTVNFDEGLLVNSGKIAIVVYISTPNAVHPIAVEYASGAETANVDLSDGEGYISLHGTHWERTEYTQHCNVCLKLYTDKVDE